MRIGQTPLIAVDGLWAKLECTNPCGSVKDRIARYILDRSEADGRLRPGQRIVEASTGNTGIAYAWLARQRGHPLTVVMPEDLPEDRKRLLSSLGADLVLVDAGDFVGAGLVRDRLARENDWFNPDQHGNPLNAECHYHTTGAEILAQHEGPIGAFVAAVGTGGTLMGVGRRLRERWPAVRLVAVEPEESPVLSGGVAGRHGICGIGEGFIPALVSDGNGGRHALIDEVIRVRTDDARRAARELAERHGFCVGFSAGANYLAASGLVDAVDGAVITVFPDGYLKYLSQGLSPCPPGACPYEHQPVIASQMTA